MTNNSSVIPKLLHILVREVRYGWVSALLIVLIVASLAGILAFLRLGSAGLEREMKRRVRDLGSNVVILPASTDQRAYHLANGVQDETIPETIVDRLLEERASLNHLIPMLVRPAAVSHQNYACDSQVVGLTASIPVPGRPKAPMRRAIQQGRVQLGSAIASELNIAQSDIAADETVSVEILGKTLPVQRVNRVTGTWQDSAVFMSLDRAQALFDLAGRISRIEAVECTSEKCALTGASPISVLESELAAVTSEAKLLRRTAIADGRLAIRGITGNSLQAIQIALWSLLVLAVIGLAGLNAYWRRAEIGVLAALGYGRAHVLLLFVARSALLAVVGALTGVLLASWTGRQLIPPALAKTGAKFTVDAGSMMEIVLITVCLATLAASFPACWAIGRQPADIIGEPN